MSETSGLVDEQERRVTVEDREARVASHRVGDRYAARVEEVGSSDVLGRGRGATREEAEDAALTSASVKIGLSAARSSLRRTMAQLQAGGDAPGDRASREGASVDGAANDGAAATLDEQALDTDPTKP